MDDQVFKVYSGSGSDRQVLEFPSGELLTWLLSCTAPAGRADIERSLRRHLGLTDPEQATMLVAYFVEHDVLTPEGTAGRYRVKGDTWERWGWRDAFEFHAATAGLRFEKLWGSEKGRQLFEEYVADPTFGPQPTIFKDVETDGAAGRAGRIGVADAADAEAATASLADALTANAEVRAYRGPGRLRVGEMAALLQHAFGTQRTMEVAVLGPHQQKSYPSGGARHPLELYVAARNVAGLAQGVYHYDPFLRELVRVADAAALPGLGDTAPGHPVAETADALAFLTVRWIRHNWKYRYARSYRMVLMEAGHAVQSLRLVGAAIGVDVAYSPAMDEWEICRLLGLQDEWQESPLCVLGFGKGGTR